MGYVGVGYLGGYPPTGTAGGVTATRGTSWTVRRTLSATRSASWGVLVKVVGAQTRSTSWSVAAQATAATFSPGIRVKVYAPMGASLGYLPAPEQVQAAFPLNDTPSLGLAYALTAPRVGLLGQPCELALETSSDNGATWSEPPDARYVYLDDARDPVATQDKYTVNGRGYVWRLDKAKVLPTDWDLDLMVDGKRPFVAATVGVILKTLLNEAQARGALQGIDHSTFNTFTDSAGAGWATVQTIYYEPGLSYHTLLLNLAQQGYCDFRMEGRSLRVFNPDTVMATDKTVTADPVIFRAGRDITEAPFRRTWEGLANYAYFAGDQGAKYEYTNPSAITPWGRQEMFIANGSVTDPGTMASLTQNELNQADRERTEYTRGLDFTRARHFPFVHYRVGDYVWSAVDGQAPERMRLNQITLTVSDRGVVAGSVTLNDRFLEADVRARRKIDGITNGASSPAPLPSPVPDADKDKTTPGAPTNLVGQSDAYMGVGGFTQSQVTLNWSAPTVNTDGTPLTDLDHYEVWQRAFGDQPSKRRLVATPTDIVHSMSPYVPGSGWLFSVKAVDTSGFRSALSAEVTVTMAVDMTPPQAPTAPTVTSKLGVLTITWDGLPATGFWPPDFRAVQVHVSTVNAFTPSDATQVALLYGEGSTVFASGSYGVPYYVRLVAVDNNGLLSPPSAQATGTPARLVGTDLDPGAITYAQIGFKDVDNLVQDGSFETAGFRGTVAARSSAAWSFTTSDKSHGSYAATINGGTSSGTSRQLVLTGTGEGQQIRAGAKLFARYAYKGEAGANGVLQLVVEWTRTGTTPLINTVWGSVINGTWQEAAVQVTAPALAESVRFYVELTSASTVGSYWVDAVEVRRTVGTAIIEDAAIKNAQIDLLAVNSANIASLDVGKLTTGSLLATVLVAGTITTASAGNRVEMTGTGLRMYRGSTMTAWFNPTPAQLRIYNVGDASLSSTGHGLQFGDDNGLNLIIDNNEIMTRFNGTRATLAINREGGTVTLGGTTGGIPDDGAGIPRNNDHRVVVGASLQVQNARDGDYAEEFSPLIVGPRAGQHLWMDGNEFGSSTGDGVGNLNIQPPSKSNGDHTQKIYIASNALQIFRMSASNAAITALDGPDVGIQFSGTNGLLVRSPGLQGYREIHATSFVVESAAEVKHSIGDLDAVNIVKAAPGKRWKYKDYVEDKDRWHAGPMANDLPAELLDVGAEGRPGYDVATLNGVLWEAVRRLIIRIETLEGRRG